MDSLLLDPVKF